jgi:aspartate-semialdehyde dehydrogenase
LRLGARFPIASAVAQVFSPASEMGSRAIEELQKQTVNLLSFQKIPQAVFGTQLAFNVLPRLGRGGRSSLTGLEGWVRRQLSEVLKKRAPLPALHIVQTPVFYSLACSLYVETAQPVPPADVTTALAGERLRLSRLTEEAPTQVEAAGSSDILVDAVSPDSSHPKGVWIWAAVDNIRLAAVNAVEIAETLSTRAVGSAR